MKIVPLIFIIFLLFGCTYSGGSIKTWKNHPNILQFENFNPYKIELADAHTSRLLKTIELKGIGSTTFQLDDNFTFEHDILEARLYLDSNTSVNLIIPYNKRGDNNYLFERKGSANLEPFSVKINESFLTVNFSGNKYLNKYQSFLESSKRIAEEFTKNNDTIHFINEYEENVNLFIHNTDFSQIGADILLNYSILLKNLQFDKKKSEFEYFKELACKKNGYYKYFCSNSELTQSYKSKHCEETSINKLSFPNKSSKVIIPKGDIIVIDFWATWCKPCQNQLRMLNDLKKTKYKNQKISIVGVSIDTELQKSFKFFSTNFPELLYYFDNGCLRDIFNINEIPKTFVFDEHYNLIISDVNANTLERDLDSLLSLK